MSESTDDAMPTSNGEPDGRPVLNYAQPGTVGGGKEQGAMNLVTIATFAQAWEAHLAAGKLESEGIPAVIADENIINASGGLYIEKDGRDIPDTFLMTADYPSEWSLFLVSTLTNDAGIPDRIYGKHGTMELGGEPSLRWNGDFKEEFKTKNDGKEEARLPLKQRRDLEGNFIDVLRGKDKLACNADLGCATMVAIKMAVESYRQKKTMLWDAKKEKVMAS